METCHALAARGHEVTLVVRPDTHDAGAGSVRVLRTAAARRRCASRSRRSPGPAAARRAGYLTFAIGRAMGRTRQDLIFTRDLGLASLLLRIPAALRAPVVYEAHGIAADVAAALPALLTGAAEASPAKLGGSPRRDAHVWSAADGYVTITGGTARRSWSGASGPGRGSRSCPTERGPRTPRISAVSHGTHGPHGPGFVHHRLRGPPVSVEGRGPGDRGGGGAAGHARADRRRPREGTGPGAGEGVRGAVELRVARHVHRTDSAGGGRGAAAGGGRAGAAEPGVRDLERVHVAAEAVRIHGVGAADRRERPAVAARGAARRRERAAGRAGQSAGARPPGSGGSRTTRRSARRLARAGGGRRPAVHVGAPGGAPRGVVHAERDASAT